MFKFSFHSIVDVITNSSTVIYVYQDDIKVTKELVQEILKLMNITGKSPDDVFYYGVFCENEHYSEFLDEREEEQPNCWDTLSYKEQEELISSLKSFIMKGEKEKPRWMEEAEENEDGWEYSRYLHLIPKEEKYEKLAEKMKEFLSSPDHTASEDG